MIEKPVEQALRLDATCVVVNLFRIPDQPEVTDQCIQNILEIKPECDRYGMPLMIEPLVFQPNEKAGGYMVDGDLRKDPAAGPPGGGTGRRHHQGRPDRRRERLSQGRSRLPAAFPCWCAAAARRPTRKSSSAPRRSSSRARRASFTAATSSSIANPAGMTRALMAIVHDGATAAQAAKFLR